MLSLNPLLPGFSADLELLATIPVACAVPLTDLAADFALDTQREVVKVIDRLRSRGFALVVANDAKGRREVWIPPHGRARIVRETERYWRDVYESPSPN